MDYKNDTPLTYSLRPPASFAQFVKRDVIANTVNIARFKVGDPAAIASLRNAINQALVRDLTRALNNIDIPPYTDATALWRIEFRGLATAVLAVPFERTRKASGFKQGDVMAWGDIYSLVAAESSKSAIRNDPILQSVTFTLVPDIPPPSGSGMASLTGQGAWTTPAPPVPQSGGNLYFSSGSSPTWTTTMQLPKGFKWSVSGNVTSPMGYQAGPATLFQTPVSGPVNISCTLTVLLQLKVYTLSTANPTGPIGIRVQVFNSSNVLVAEGDSVRQSDGRYALLVQSLPPGVYTLKANKATSGGSWSGTTTVNVQRGVLQEATLTVTYTPPGPPPP